MKHYCWYEKNAWKSEWTHPHADKVGTQPVGLKKPNAWGLYDMSGNVFEWCSDWYGPYSSALQVDPRGTISGSERVQRGGSWILNAPFCRSAYRNRLWPGYRHRHFGFRVVRSTN